MIEKDFHVNVPIGTVSNFSWTRKRRRNPRQNISSIKGTTMTRRTRNLVYAAAAVLFAISGWQALMLTSGDDGRRSMDLPPGVENFGKTQSPPPQGPGEQGVPPILDFTAPRLGGGTISGADYSGKALALWFWAPW